MLWGRRYRAPVHEHSPGRPRRFDLRTLSLAVAILGGYALWSLNFHALPNNGVPDLMNWLLISPNDGGSRWP